MFEDEKETEKPDKILDISEEILLLIEKIENNKV